MVLKFIYGFNECGWKLYKIFERCQISVKGIGHGWGRFYPKAIWGYVNSEIFSKTDMEYWCGGEKPRESARQYFASECGDCL